MRLAHVLNFHIWLIFFASRTPRTSLFAELQLQLGDGGDADPDGDWLRTDYYVWSSGSHGRGKGRYRATGGGCDGRFDLPVDQEW